MRVKIYRTIFQPISPPEIHEELKVSQLKANIRADGHVKVEEVPLPKFGALPNAKKAYNFDNEIVWLPFKFYFGDTPFPKDQKGCLLNLIYDNQQIFSLHYEDPGFCDKLVHTIFITKDKPIYMPHKSIPRYLQGEVHKYCDIWLHQGIIRLSRSLCASQVVIVCKKSSQICLCMGYQKLNSKVVRDSFPLPWRDQALQAVHNCQWLSLFDLAQGYLQMTVMKQILRKQPSELAHLAYRNLHRCHLAYQTWSLALAD